MINVGDDVQIVSPRAISNGTFGKVEGVDARQVNRNRYYLVRQLGKSAVWFKENSLVKVKNEGEVGMGKNGKTVTLERNDTNTFDSNEAFVMVEGFDSVFIRDVHNDNEILTVIYSSPNDGRDIYTGAVVDVIDNLYNGQMTPFKGKIVIEQ